jgi:transglutaminase-like putative cysteine protease
VRHATRFSYAGEARVSVSEARLTPSRSPGQWVERFELTVRPEARILGHVDGFGTEVSVVFATIPHRRMVILSRSVVRLEPPGEVPEGSWEEVSRASDDLDWRLPTPKTTLPARYAGTRLDIRASSRSPRSFVEATGRWVGRTLRYAPDATDVGADLDRVFSAGGGVCQDFAHALAALLRVGGLPARYVSGYLARPGSAGGGHAWVEARLDRESWRGFDPVHGVWVTDQHVRVAAGRDYDDVSPVRGTYEGPPEHELHVEVTVREL